MTRSLALLLLAVLWIGGPSLRGQEPEPAAFDHDHGPWTRVLAAVVRDGRVDYETLARDRSDLDLYVTRLSTQSALDFARWTKPQQCAFWLNAYNAFTLQAVLANYPLLDMDSLRDVGGKESGKVWKQRRLPLGRLFGTGMEVELSLDDIVERILRPQFRDARVHAALCNSCLGSPALAPRAFTATGLDRELDGAAHAWLADPRRTIFSREHRRVEASIAFDTYRQDFARDQGSVEGWIARFAPRDQRTWLAEPAGFERRTLAFDWKLNDIELNGGK